MPHGADASLAMIARLLAQVQIRDRTGDAAAWPNNGFCPDWIVDNFDRYVDPLLPARLPDAVLAVAIGFAIAFALALVAHRRRWLVGPITQVTGILYTIPSLAVVLPAAADHRARQHHGADRARRLHRC